MILIKKIRSLGTVTARTKLNEWLTGPQIFSQPCFSVRFVTGHACDVLMTEVHSLGSIRVCSRDQRVMKLVSVLVAADTKFRSVRFRLMRLVTAQACGLAGLRFHVGIALKKAVKLLVTADAGSCS